MKLTVEIKDNKFFYSYVIGTSEHNSSIGLCAETLTCFVDLLRRCYAASNHNRRQWEVEVLAKEMALKMNGENKDIVKENK